jgi:hypothetical protein
MAAVIFTVVTVGLVGARVAMASSGGSSGQATLVSPAEISGGGGCGGSTQEIDIYPGTSSPEICVNASNIFGTYQFNWTQTVDETNSSTVKFEETAVGGGSWSGIGDADYGTYWAVDPATDTSEYEPSLICYNLTSGSHSTGVSFTAKDVSSSDPPYGKLLIWGGDTTCPSSDVVSATNHFLVSPQP